MQSFHMQCRYSRWGQANCIYRASLTPQDAGLEDTLDPFICNILVALSQSVFVVVSMLLVDRLVLRSDYLRYHFFVSDLGGKFC